MTEQQIALSIFALILMYAVFKSWLANNRLGILQSRLEFLEEWRRKIIRTGKIQ